MNLYSLLVTVSTYKCCCNANESETPPHTQYEWHIGLFKHQLKTELHCRAYYSTVSFP